MDFPLWKDDRLIDAVYLSRNVEMLGDLSPAEAFEGEEKGKVYRKRP